MRIVTESAQPSAMQQPAATTVSIAREEVPVFGRHAATVSEHSRLRRPTVESVFAPSPFAYNKKLATATPSVANLRDVERVKDQPSALSRRHSVGRIDPRRPRLSVGVSHSSFQSGLTDGNDPAQCLSPSSARRLLSTLNSLNTPILDARGRLVSSQSSTVGVTSGLQYSAATGERLAALPLRRLPVSLLALSDTPNKTHRSPLGDSVDVLDKETLRRSSSLRSTLRNQNTAPSLARTIQMKQARKAVAERLLQYKSAESSYAGSDASSCSATHSPLSAAPECFEDVAVAGVVHSREDDEEHTASKRRRAASGEAVRLSGDGELDGVAMRASGVRVGRPKQATGKRLGRAGRSLSTVDSNVRWRFSARLAPASDDEADSSSESDEDREALTAKVPLSKIRGGELLGLSQHLTTSTQSTSNGVGLSAVRSTGFGSNRTPIPIFSEPETKEAPAAAPPATSVFATAPLLSVAAATAAAPAAPDSAPAPASVPVVPVADSAPVEATPVAKAVVPASSSLFSGISFKPASETTDANKAEAVKPAAPVAPATSSASLFNFSKPAETAEKPADAPDSVSEVPTAPTTPVFSYTKTSATDTTSSIKPIADTWGKSMALSGVFGVKAPTADTTGATTPELAPKPATSAPTFSFNLSKPAAATSTADASKPAAVSSLFSLGSAAPSAPATTTPAATAEEKPKSFGSFNFGSFGAASSSDAPNIPTTKGARVDETTEPASAVPKPAFNFQAAATGGGGGFNFTSSASTSTPSLFGSLASKDTSSTTAAAPAATVAAAPAAAASGFGSSNTFTFGATAPSSSTGTASTLFSFSLGVKPVPAPEKIIDTTMDSSDSNAATSAPGSIFGSGTASAAAPLFGTSSSKAPAASTNTFNFGASTFGGSTAAKPTTGPAEASTPIFGGFGQSTSSGSAAPEPTAKKPMFSLGASVGTPGASIFESASIATPSTTNFSNTVAAAPTLAFGAATATPSVFGFGSAASSAATPATTGFTFGAKPTLQQSNTFGSISSQLGTSGFGNTSTSSTGGGNVFGSMMTSQPISNGFGNAQSLQSTSNMFGSTQPSQTTSNVFGNSQPSQTTSSTFGASSGGLGFGSSSGQRNASTGSFTFGNPTSSTGFGESFTGTGGFGQQQPASSAVPSFGSQPGGFGSTAGNSAFGGASNTSAFGGASNTSAFGAGPPGPTPQFQFGQSNQTPSTAGFRFGAAPPTAGSTPQTPFVFSSNASVQEGGPPSSHFQFGGVAQHSSTGVGGGMSLGRVTGASNASATSQGRRIARPRGRRH
ncbi:hypothetical protein IW152_000425 [Coemansia sp. BCRC 34962]|nr:hypothetical protein IW152_000425 [Coemansia sp. BCRC 34962]